MVAGITDYHKKFNEHGESPKALQWQNYKSSAERYRELVADLDIRGKSVLDAGCGMGDILPYIYANAPDFEYLGVDIIEDFIEIARKRYLGHEFRVLDALKEEFGQKFDIVLSCGILNSNIDNWLEERQQRIQKLYSLANEAFAFNMAGSFQPKPGGKRVAEADTKEIINFCAGLTSKVILKTHYHPKDFTIVMFK